MKNTSRILLSTALAVLIGFVAYFKMRPAQVSSGNQPQPAVVATRSPSVPVQNQASLSSVAGAVAQAPLSPASVPFAVVPAFAIPAEAPPEVRAFREWAREYLAAAPADRAGLEKRGAELAAQHTAAIAALIPTDPQAAIENAVPMAVRQDLPLSITALLEKRVNQRGTLALRATVAREGLPAGELPALPAAYRTFETEDGKSLRAHVYGRRAKELTLGSTRANGVAVGKEFAVSPDRVRVLEVGERPDSAKAASEVCPVSGIVTPVERKADAALPAITEATPAVEDDGQVHYLCSGGHWRPFSDQLADEETRRHWADLGADTPANEGGTGGPTAPWSVPTTWSTGNRTILYIRATFPDHQVDPQTEAESYDMLRQVSDYMSKNSYGRCYFTYTVAPLVVLPYPESWYVQLQNEGSSADILLTNHARAVAKSMGYDTANYVLDAVRWNGTVGQFGGAAYVGAKLCMLKGNGVGTAAHEFGHNLGLMHSNRWQTTPPSSIGPGENHEYGNSFDVMGTSSSLGHYTAFGKSQLSWLLPENYATVTGSGTYRIFQVDQSTVDPAKRYAIKIRKDSERDYWLEYRQQFTTNNWLMNGLMVTWDEWGLGGISGSGGNPTTGSNDGPHLLDMTPGSAGPTITDTRNDAALVIGKTFSDAGSGIHMTPIARVTTTTPQAMDVVVNLGDFPGNQAPVLSLAASATSVGTGVSVTLAATASDPDGDALAYAWDFGDASFSTNNAAVQTKSWSAAGHYTVRCTASDMKGKVTTRRVVVTVGAPATYTFSGRVTDPQGQPLEGVYVSNYAVVTGTSHGSASAFRSSYTDSNGDFTVTGLPSGGSYTFAANLYPYTFTAAFANPVTMSGNQTAKDFTSAQFPVVTVTATDADAAEAAAPGTGVIRLSRTGSTTAALNVQVFNASTGTATRGSDYSVSPAFTSVAGGSGASQYTISAGASFLDITVTPINDSAVEGVEYATLNFANTAGGYVFSGPESAAVAITDDDSAVPVVTLQVDDSLANEDGDAASLTVTRNGATTNALTVFLTRAGTAVTGTDYNAPASVVIPAGASSASFTLAPLQDAVAEGTETMIISLTANATYARDTLSQTTTVSLNDDDLPTVSIAATDATAGEAGANTGLFTITRAGSDLAQALIVDYALGGSAIHGTDYRRLDGRATIPAGQAETTILIEPYNDTIDEPDQTVVCQLRATGLYQITGAGTATVTLLDDDVSQFTAKSNAAPPVVEPTSGTSAQSLFLITRPASGAAVTVNYTISGTATSGVDFVALPGTIAFAAGDTSKTISVTINSDGANVNYEDAESIVLTIQPGTGYTPGFEPAATAWIVDSTAQPTVDVGFADSSSGLTGVGEATASLRFIVSRRASTSSALTVNYTMGGTATEGADYTGATGSAVIPANATYVYVTLALVNDTIQEGTESVTMNLTPALGTYSLRTPSATALIIDNDAFTGIAVGYSAAASTVGETAGTVTIPVALTGTPAGPVTVQYRVNGGTAVAQGVDYAFTNGKLTFQPGGPAQNLTLSVTNDSFAEPSETVILQLLNPTGSNLGTSAHTVTITNVSLPEAWTDVATSVLTASATLNGRVIPNGQATNVWFEYGPTTAYGTSTAPQAMGSGTASVSVTAPVSGLAPQVYHYRTVAQNSAGTTYGIDQIFSLEAPPTITSITPPANGAYRAGQNLDFVVNFSKAVTVTGTDSTLGIAVGTGSWAANYLSKTSASVTYRYTVQAGDTDADGVALGTLKLNSSTITDTSGRAATLTYTAPNTAGVRVDTTAPTLAVSAPSATSTASGPVTYTITFADANFSTSTLALADLSLNQTGTATGTVALSGSGASYTATVSGISGTGTLGITVAAGKASDTAGNLAPGATGAVFNVNNTAPVVTGVTSSPANGAYKAGTLFPVVVNFSAPVTVTGSPRVQLNAGAAVFANYVGGSGSNNLTFNYIVGAGDTSADLDYTAATALTLNGGTIMDGVGNNALLTLPTPGGASSLGGNKALVIDTTAPTVAVGLPSVTRTSAGPLSFVITYADTNFSASTLTAANVNLNITGTANATVTVSGTGATRTVTLTNITGDGMLGLHIAAGTATDTAGNLAPNSTASAGCVVDNTAPTLTSRQISSNNASPQWAKVGNVITLSLTASEAINAPVVTLAGRSAAVTGSGTAWTASITATGTDPEGPVALNATFSDLAGNAGASATTTTNASTVTIDRTAPTVALSAPSSAITKTGPVSYTATYADANFSVSTLTVNQVTVNKTGTANGTAAVGGAGTTRTVSFSGITGDGSLGFTLATGTASDMAGNLAPASAASAVFAVDNTAPMLTIGAPSVAATASGAVTYAISYTDANFGASNLLAGDLILNKTGTANGTVALSGNGASYTATISGISGNGTLGLTVAAGKASDTAGNLAPGATSATVSVAPVLAVSTNAALPNAIVGTNYSQSLAATGGTPPYTWSLNSGSTLPAWLTLSPSGVLTGTPPTSATLNFTVKVTDAASASATKALTLTVVAPPEIAVEQPAGTGLVDGAALTFSPMNIGAASPALTVTVKNTGTGDLTDLSITKDGAHAADFTVGNLGAATLAPNASTTFSVTFNPSAAGPRTAALHLASNDADENPFDITLNGTSLTRLETWRQTHFNTIENTGDAADLADPERDGVLNLMEFATNGLPLASAPGTGSAALNDANLTFTYTRSKAALADGLVFAVEWSDTMAANSWSAVGVTETILSETTTIQQVQATLPAGIAGHRLTRLKVSPATPVIPLASSEATEE